MIYVYAIADDPDVPLGQQPGLDGSPVQVLVTGGLAAICSRHARIEPGAHLRALQQHHGVVEAAMSHCTVVPTRFGTSFSDDDALADLLWVRQVQLTRLLADLRGKVELALRIHGVDGGPGDDSFDDLHANLSGLAAAAVLSRRRADAMSAAYLVDRAGLPSFQRSSARIVGAHTKWRASLTGPWPPYSFVNATELPPLSDKTTVGCSHG